MSFFPDKHAHSFSGTEIVFVWYEKAQTQKTFYLGKSFTLRTSNTMLPRRKYVT